jgi:hypothetical protein
VYFVRRKLSPCRCAFRAFTKIYTYFVKGAISPEVENDIITPSKDFLIPATKSSQLSEKILKSLHFMIWTTMICDKPLAEWSNPPPTIVRNMYLFAGIPNPVTDPFDFYQVYWKIFTNTAWIQIWNYSEPETVAGHLAYYQSPDYDKMDFCINVNTSWRNHLLDGINRITGSSTIAKNIHLWSDKKFRNCVKPFRSNINRWIMQCAVCTETNSERITLLQTAFYCVSLAIIGQMPGIALLEQTTTPS